MLHPPFIMCFTPSFYSLLGVSFRCDELEKIIEELEKLLSTPFWEFPITIQFSTPLHQFNIFLLPFGSFQHLQFYYQQQTHSSFYSLLGVSPHERRERESLGCTVLLFLLPFGSFLIGLNRYCKVVDALDFLLPFGSFLSSK